VTVETPRLTLLPCTPRHLLTLIEQPGRFEDVVGVRVAPGLLEFYTSGDVSPEWIASLRRSADADADPWQHGYFVVHREQRLVIGSAGFKGPPDGNGAVEIAYGIVPSFQGQGYATEAARALLEVALAADGVRSILAHTLPEPNASTRVLLRCGFRHVGTVVDPEDGPVWRWEWVGSERAPADGA
jgi:RimJ/RimL family protein N-acetyltransferase